MPNDFYTQQALANDPTFRRRVKSAGSLIAWEVLNENPATQGHAARATYSRFVLANLDSWVNGIVGSLVMRTNIFAANTSVSLDLGIPVVSTAATDAEIQSQLATDWSNLAGA